METSLTPKRRVTHYGVARFGEMGCEAVVLDDGSRGYLRRQMAEMIGQHVHNRSSRFTQICADFAPKSLSLLEKSDSQILMPHGGVAQFFPAGVVPDIASGVIAAALEGRLHKSRLGMVAPCLKIIHALASTGEVALIDEATGYQYHRAPDALQELIGKLLRQSGSSWERRFQPDYYRAIYRLFGWRYQGHVQNPPHVLGQITLRWVYAQVLPPELLDEIRNRKGLSEKHHQWLSERGLERLTQQIHSVTAIARCSANYRDFDHRCEAAFAGGALQLGLLLEELEEGA